MSSRAIIYTRLSADRDGAEQTLTTQEQVCRQLAAANGLDVLEVFAEGSGRSAFKDTARPAMEALLAKLDEEPELAVIAWEVSRLTRRLSELSSWIERVDSGARILTPQLDTGAPAGRLILSMMAALADEESRQKSVRVQAGKERARDAGAYLGGAAPYGFNRSDSGERYSSTLTINAEQAAIVRKVAEHVLAGGSVRSAVRLLNDANQPSPTGKAWRHQTLTNILRSPVTAGLAETNSGELVQRFPAILTHAEHRQLVALLGKRAGRGANARKAGGIPKSLLSGLLACGSCGASMTFDRSRSQRGSYRCSAASSGACSAGAVASAHLLEPLVVRAALQRIDSLQSKIADGDSAADAELGRLFAGFGSPVAEREVASLTEAELAELDAREATLVDRFGLGKLSEAALDSALGKINDRRAELAELLPAAVSASAELPINAAELLDNSDNDEQMLAAVNELPVTQARELLAAALGSVTVAKGRQGRPLQLEQLSFKG